MSALACSSTPSNSSPASPIRILRQLPDEGNWIIGSSFEQTDLFALNVDTGELFALRVARGGMLPLAMWQTHPELAQQRWQIAISTDGRRFFHPYDRTVAVEVDGDSYRMTNWSMLLSDRNGEIALISSGPDKGPFHLIRRPDETAAWTLFQSEAWTAEHILLPQVGPDEFTVYLMVSDSRQYQVIALNSQTDTSQQVAVRERPRGEMASLFHVIADGRTVYALFNDDRHYELIRFSAAANSWQTIWQSAARVEPLIRHVFAADGQTLFLGWPDSLLAVNMVDGSSTTLRQYNNQNQQLTDFALSPDGQRIVYLQQMEPCRSRRDIEGNVIGIRCRQELFVIDVDGRQQKQLTQNLTNRPALNWFAWWQPAQQAIFLTALDE